MSEINGTGLGSGSGKMPSELSISDFGGLTPTEYAAVLASAFSGNPSGELIDYSDIIEGDIALGNTVVMADAEWLVIDYRDDEYNRFVLRKNVGIMAAWNSSGTNTNIAYNHANNGARAALDNYAATLSSDIISAATPVTKFGVTQKVFMPTNTDYNGAYSNSASSTTTLPGAYLLCRGYNYSVNCEYRVLLNASGTTSTSYYINDSGVSWCMDSSGKQGANNTYTAVYPCHAAMQFKLRNKT